MINIFEPRTMLSMINSPKYQVKTFLRDHYFTNIKTFQTKTVDIDIRDRHKRKAASFVSRRSGGSQDFRDGYSTSTFTPGFVAPYRVTTAEDELNRLPGEDVYSDKSPEDRASTIMADDFVELDELITRREEIMCAQAITTGKVIVKYDDVKDKEGNKFEDKVDYWQNLTVKPYMDLSVTASWNGPNANPLKNLRKICKDIVKISGLTPVEMILGDKAVDALMDYLDDTNKVFNARRANLGQISPSSEDDKGVQYIGTLTLPYLDMYSYNEWYLDDDTDQVLPLIPEDSIVIACKNVKATRAYGPVNIIDEKERKQKWYAEPRMPNSWLEITGENAGRNIQIKSAPLMIVNEPLGFWCIKVVA